MEAVCATPQPGVAPTDTDAFDGEGLQVASARVVDGANDEFEYAFNAGEARHGQTHVKHFKPAAAPAFAQAAHKPGAALTAMAEDDEVTHEQESDADGASSLQPPAPDGRSLAVDGTGVPAAHTSHVGADFGPLVLEVVDSSQLMNIHRNVEDEGTNSWSAPGNGASREPVSDIMLSYMSDNHNDALEALLASAASPCQVLPGQRRASPPVVGSLSMSPATHDLEFSGQTDEGEAPAAADAGVQAQQPAAGSVTWEDRLAPLSAPAPTLPPPSRALSNLGGPVASIQGAGTTSAAVVPDPELVRLAATVQPLPPESRQEQRSAPELITLPPAVPQAVARPLGSQRAGLSSVRGAHAGVFASLAAASRSEAGPERPVGAQDFDSIAVHHEQLSAGLTQLRQRLAALGQLDKPAPLGPSKSTPAQAGHQVVCAAVWGVQGALYSGVAGRGEATVGGSTAGGPSSLTSNHSRGSSLQYQELPSVQLLRVISRDQRSFETTDSLILQPRTESMSRVNAGPSLPVPPAHQGLYTSYPPAQPAGSSTGRIVDLAAVQRSLQAAASGQPVNQPLATYLTAPSATPAAANGTAAVRPLQGSADGGAGAGVENLQAMALAAAQAGANALAHLRESQARQMREATQRQQEAPAVGPVAPPRLPAGGTSARAQPQIGAAPGVVEVGGITVAVAVTAAAPADEWDAANAARAAEAASHASAPAWTRVPYTQLQQRVQQMVWPEPTLAAARDSLAASSVAAPRPGFFARLFCLAPGPRTTAAPPAADKVAVVCWARTPYNNDIPLHWDLLASSYCAFTGNDRAPARTGSHWAALGWQGDDPATDLRGCGVLGLIQLCSLWEHNPSAAGALYRLSRSTTQEFPLAIVSINVTKYTLQALREGRLDGATAQLGGVWGAVAAFHAGGMATFGRLWRDGQRTMKDSGFVMKDLEQACLSRTADVLAAAKTGFTL